MESFDQTKLRRIQQRFQEETGVALPAAPRRHPLRTTVLLAAVLALALSLSAFAAGLFSPLAGDDLSLSADYLGDGLVAIQVENNSDKELVFQPQLKLMRWSTAREVQPLSDTILFENTDFAPHSSGVMTVDLSRAYDLALLEEPLTDDHYYFVLTNNNFLFGQDWMCTVTFAEPLLTPQEEADPMTPAEADAALVDRVEAELQPYFQNYPTDVEERRERAEEYLAKCGDLLAELGVQVVPTASPMLALDCFDTGVVFDETVPPDSQHQLTWQSWSLLDGYGLPVGASAEDRAMVLSAIVPQHEGDIDGASLPLAYFFAYQVSDIGSGEDYAFVHGRLLTFREMEEYKVYEDGEYVLYDVTDLFYTDLHQHVESMASQRSDIYFDQQVWTRVENLCRFFRDREVLASRLVYVGSGA